MNHGAEWSRRRAALGCFSNGRISARPTTQTASPRVCGTSVIAARSRLEFAVLGQFRRVMQRSASSPAVERNAKLCRLVQPTRVDVEAKCIQCAQPTRVAAICRFDWAVVHTAAA